MSEPLLQVDSLGVAFGAADAQPAVVDVSFSVDYRQTVALVGESGSGKSVTALSVMQLLPYPFARHPAGSILYRGEQLLGAGQSVMRAVRGNEISMIFQEPMTSLNPLHTVDKQIAESLRLHKGLTGEKARSRVLQLLDQVGIRDAAQRLGAYPHELSGGQRQRVMIAMALANEPDLLIADEPTTALDVTIQAQILALLKQLQQDLGMALILITHDLGVVRKMADIIHVMKDGEVVEQGGTDEVFLRATHPYTQHLLSAEPSPKQARNTDATAEIISGSDIRVWYPIKKGLLGRVSSYVKACDGVDISVHAGRTVGVVGESGSGKTTLGLALMRLVSSQGEIHFRGEPVHSLDNRQMRSFRNRMQIVFQDPFGSLSPRLSVQQIVEEGLQVHEPALTQQERLTQVSRVLDDVGLSSASMYRFPHEFSGGQRQRIAIARAMVLKPSLVVLDEPTSALDMSVQVQIVELLRALQDRYQLAYIFISHDLKVVRALSDEIIVMRRGKVVESGDAQQIVSAPQTEYTKALMSAAFDLEATDSPDIVAD